MLSKIKDIDPLQLTDVIELRSVLLVLMNIVEEQSKAMDELKRENGELKDTINRLKGGNARPVIRPSAKVGQDISSGGKEKGAKNFKKYADKAPLSIDREIKVGVEPAELPSDAVFKGYADYVQQDIILQRDNKLFRFETWYSASLQRKFTADWPDGEQSGHYGPGVRSLINVLQHYGDMTQGRLEGLLGSLGVQISGGTINKVLAEQKDWAVEEQRSILQAALHQAEPKQMDSTGNRQKGVSKVTHIITASFFSVFYTLDSKSRLDCLRALQGNPREGLGLLWHPQIEADLKRAKVGAAHRQALRLLMPDQICLTWPDFEQLMQEKAPAIHARKKVMRAIGEVMALAYYAQQTDFPALAILLSDDAPEYRKLAPFHALCWVHDARYYNKLDPKITLHRQKLDDFKSRYWEFYRKLLDFKEQTYEKQQTLKTILAAEFDQIFSPNTKYGALDLAIQRTLSNKEQLLLVLEHPAVPLHNNAAELGARRVVRKRDISLHTWSDGGTQLRDAFLSIIETAIKLGVSAYEFIHDRVAQKNDMPALSTLIYNKPAFTPTF